MSTKLQAHQIEAAHQALSKVKSIDEAIAWWGRATLDDMKCLGDKLRGPFAPTPMAHFTDARLGEVVNRAVINALLAMRAEAIANSGELVEFPDAPYPQQPILS